MTVGIVYIVFGYACNNVAAHCIKYSRKFTKLPITVIQNISQKVNLWNTIPNIDYITMDLPISENREIKTRLIKYTPYDFTIYLDADSIIQDERFDEEVLKMIEQQPDLILNHFCTYPYPDGNFQNIYLRALKQFECEMPLKVYNGAFIGFAKNITTKLFFGTWNTFWDTFGRQREMPPLSCAINKIPSLSICELPANFFSPDTKNDKAAVQHNYHADFWARIGCEPMELSAAHYEVGDYGFTKI